MRDDSIDMGDDSIDMGDDSIDMGDDSIDVGYLVILAGARTSGVARRRAVRVGGHRAQPAPYRVVGAPVEN